MDDKRTNLSSPNKQEWRRRLIRSGYFLGAVLFHLILFLMVATRVIWNVSPPPPGDEFRGVVVAKVPPPPPAPPPPAGAAAANPQMEPQPVVVPVETPRSIITGLNHDFTVDTSKALDQTLGHMSLPMPQGTGLAGAGSGDGTGTGGETSLFGSANGLGMQGYLYDLKQTSDRVSTGMNFSLYEKTIADFVGSGWDESRLEKFYKSPTALHASTIFIPTLLASVAPKSFGVEKEVQPTMFIVVYHATISPTQGGDFRLVGMGDDVMIARVNQRMVLDGSLEEFMGHPLKKYQMAWEDPNSKPAIAFPYTKRYGSLRIGESFHVDADEEVSFDLLIGEESGGWSAYFLFLTRDGDEYENAPNGFPKLPLFQIGTTPVAAPTGQFPPYSLPTITWQMAQ